MEIEPGEPLEQRVESPRSQAREERLAAAIRLDGLDHVEAIALPRPDHVGDQPRRMLQVPIHDDHGVAARSLESRAQRLFLAEAPAQSNGSQRRMSGRVAAWTCGASVATLVPGLLFGLDTLVAVGGAAFAVFVLTAVVTIVERMFGPPTAVLERKIAQLEANPRLPAE